MSAFDPNTAPRQSSPSIPHASHAARPDPEEQIARLALLRCETLGPFALGWIMRQFASALAFEDAGPEARSELTHWLNQQIGGRQSFRNRHKTVDICPALPGLETTKHRTEHWIRQGAVDTFPAHPFAVQRWLRRWLDDPGHHVLWSENDPDYPSSLREAEDGRFEPGLRPWRVLFVEGSRHIFSQPCLAIVGGRTCSDRGASIAQGFAEALASRGLTIVSGMAEGIDAAAHTGALKGSGATIAVMATGMDRTYPSQHLALRETIAQRGAVVTRLMPGQRVDKFRFLQRNRIIAGLSQGVLVVQARLKSGALSTAQSAAEFGRGVFAVPGSIDDPRCKGCHQLIRNGATLVERAEDIFADLPWLLPLIPAQPPPSAGSIAHRGADRNNPTDPADPSDFSNPADPADPENRPGPADRANTVLSKALERLGNDPFDIHHLASCLGVRYDEALVEALRLEVAGVIVRLADGRYEAVCQEGPEALE